MRSHTSHVKACQSSAKIYRKQSKVFSPLQRSLRKIKKSSIVRQDCFREPVSSLLYQASSQILLVVNEHPRFKLYLFILLTGGFLKWKDIPCMVWGPKLGLGKKICRQYFFLLFTIISINLLHLICAIACAHASTHVTGLMLVKIACTTSICDTFCQSCFSETFK